MFGLGAGEILVVLVFALLFIGPKKLPELAKGLGKGIREFQKAKNDIVESVNLPDLKSSMEDSFANMQNTEVKETEPSEEEIRLKPAETTISRTSETFAENDSSQADQKENSDIKNS
jgi:TatA/E family protein of Tat protein translocase